MKPCLADVNVLLALLFKQHEHHAAARRWAEKLGPSEAWICRTVQFSVVRLLSTPAVVGAAAVPLSAAWNLMETLLQDERFNFAAEPEGLEAALPALFRYKTPTRSLAADIYPAAFAIASSRRLVTFDRGFAQFQGLETEILR